MRYINLIIVFVYVSFLSACGLTLNPPEAKPYLNKTYRFKNDMLVCESNDHSFSITEFRNNVSCGSVYLTKADYAKNPSYYNQWHYNGLFYQNRVTGIVKKNTRFRALAIYRPQAMSDMSGYVDIEILDGSFTGLKGYTEGYELLSN